MLHRKPVSDEGSSNEREIDLDFELSQGFARTLIRKVVHRTSRKIPLNDYDKEDFEQTLSMELFRRAGHFEPRLGSWEAFSAKVVSNCLKTEIERFMRRRDQEPRPMDLYEELAEVEDVELKLADLRMDEQFMLRLLLPSQRDLCERLKYDSLRSISEQLGIPRRTLRDRLKKIRKRLNEDSIQENAKKSNSGPPTRDAS